MNFKGKARAMNLLQAAKNLSRDLENFSISPPVTHVYNPLIYAWEGYRQYLERFIHPGVEVVLLGMNPGPWGMAQTGVPFGVISAVRDWMRIDVKVEKPAREHPKRPILGLECTRMEVSGKRLWGWARERYGEPEAFFRRFAVLNYCPLSFMEESGRNRTPDKLKKAERESLYKACDLHLRRCVQYLEPHYVIGIGNFAQQRILEALGGNFPEIVTGRILHPSPANPHAHGDWGGKVEAQMKDMGIAFSV